MSDFNLCFHNTYRKDIIYTGLIIVMTCSKCEGRKTVIWSELFKIKLPADLYLLILNRRKILMCHQKKPNTLRDLPTHFFMQCHLGQFNFPGH